MNSNNNNCPKSIENAKKLAQLGCLQTKAAIIDSEAQLNRLTEHFTEIIEIEAKISKNLEQNLSVVELFQQLRQLIISTTIEFQFFDRLKQKLEHAIEPLENWTESGKLTDPSDKSFANRYTTLEERELYNVLMDKGSIQETLNIISLNSSEQNSEDDIELF